MSEYEEINNTPSKSPEELLAIARNNAWERLAKLDHRFYWETASEVEPAFLTRVAEIVEYYQNRIGVAKDAVQDWIQAVDPDDLDYHEQTMLGRLEEPLGIETEIEIDFDVEVEISIRTKRKVWDKQDRFIEDTIDALDIRVHNNLDYSIDSIEEA